MAVITSRRYLPATPSLARWIGAGFVAGALSALVFHQGTVALLNLLGMSDRMPWSVEPTEPFGVPQIASIVFWGGVWGAALAAALRRLDGARLVAAFTVLGAVLPTLVAWFFVAPLKGQPMAAGLEPMALAFGLIANSAWGLGAGLGLLVFGGKWRADRRHRERRQPMADRRRVNRRRGEPQPYGV